jgi:hypothetical protein
MKKLIHINRNIIQYNAKHGTNLPVCRIQDGSMTRYGMAVDILGPSRMVYDPENPLKCGAKLWIETDADIEIDGECTYQEIQGMKAELA